MKKKSYTLTFCENRHYKMPTGKDIYKYRGLVTASLFLLLKNSHCLFYKVLKPLREKYNPNRDNAPLRIQDNPPLADYFHRGSRPSDGRYRLLFLHFVLRSTGSPSRPLCYTVARYPSQQHPRWGNQIVPPAHPLIRIGIS